MKARLAREQMRVTFLGKILCLLISAIYIVVGIGLLGLTIYYMDSVFGMHQQDYAKEKEKCKNRFANEELSNGSIRATACKGLRYTFAAIIITFILTILLIAGGIFLAVMVFCRLFPKRWWIVWLVVNVLILLHSILILILLAMASHDNNLQAACQQRHTNYKVKSYGKELKSVCKKGNNFVSYIPYPKCWRGWDRFEAGLYRLYKTWYGILIALLCLNLIGFVLFLVVVVCLRNKKGDPNTLEIVNLPPDITENDLQKQFPHAKQIVIDKKYGEARVVFWKEPDVMQDYENSGLLKLGTGPPTVGWLRQEELYLEDIPLEFSESDLMQEFPTAKSVKFQDIDEPEFKRVATVVFATAADQNKAFNGSPRKKLAPQRLSGGAKDPGIEVRHSLEVSNLPPGTTEADLMTKFPTAIEVKMGDGRAVVYFASAEDKQKAYEDASIVKFAKPKLGWMRPEEFYIHDVPPNLKEPDLIKQFPTAQSAKIQKGPGGKKIGKVVFASESDQQKAYDESDWNKPGPQKLGYGGSLEPAAGAGGPTELQLTNIPPGVSEKDLKKRFPKAKSIKISNGTAFVRFGNASDANKAYDGSGMLKFGKSSSGRKLGFLRPEEVYITDVPVTVTDKDLLRDFPTATGVKFQNGEGGKRIATLIFPNENEQKKAFSSSAWKQLGSQKLVYGGDGGGMGRASRVGGMGGADKKNRSNDDGTNPGDINEHEELNDDELAKKLWKIPEADYSNISNLFHPKLYIQNLPAGVTRAQLISHFEGAVKADIQGRLGIMEFDTPVQAAHAYNKAQKNPLNGTILKVSIHAPRKKSKKSVDVASRKSKLSRKGSKISRRGSKLSRKGSKVSRRNSKMMKRPSRPSLKNKIQPS